VAAAFQLKSLAPRARYCALLRVGRWSGMAPVTLRTWPRCYRNFSGA